MTQTDIIMAALRWFLLITFSIQRGCCLVNAT
jgi:hypothetical protein